MTRRVGARALALVAALAGGGGCTVGEGAGSAVGTLRDVGCNKDNTLEMLEPYSLQPAFFAGVPIEDVCPPPGHCSGPRTDRLVIRMQHTGNPVEVTDTLYFDVLNSYKVAQCLRGQIKNGVPQWDVRDIIDADGNPIPGIRWCDWGALGVDGGAATPDAGPTVDVDGGAVPLPVMGARARINLSTQDLVQSELAPNFTCIEARSVGVALPGSWIDFEDFGQAEQPALPPDQRTDVPGDFKVDFGDRLRATFHLILGDQAVYYARKTNALVPDPRIDGTLDGSFDFDLERGRAAQPFP